MGSRIAVTPDSFGAFLALHPGLGKQLRSIAASQPRRGRLGFISDAITLLFLLPLLKTVLVEFGLPWRLDGGVFAAAHWQRLKRWVERDYLLHGVPSARALVVAGTLMRELEATEGLETRAEWEELLEALRGGAPEIPANGLSSPGDFGRQG